MKVEEIRNLSTDEIDAKVIDLKKALFQLRVQAKNQKLEQMSRLKETKTDIARLLTVRNALKRAEKAKG